MAAVNFGKITAHVLNNIRARTMKSASWRKPLLNVMDRVVTPIAMNQTKVAENIKMDAMRLQGEMNQKLFDLPENRPISAPVKAQPPVAPPSEFDAASDLFSSPSMISIMSDVGKKAANGNLNVSGIAPAGEVTSILTFHKDEKKRFAGELLCGDKDAELTTFADKGIYGLTYLGKREKNQDAVAAHVTSDGTIHLMVADGMGGETHGELASEEASINFLKYLIENKSVKNLIPELDAALKSLGDRSPHLKGMGTTMTTVEIKDGEAIVRHVGDSLALLIKASGELSLLTFPNWQHFSDFTLMTKTAPYNEADIARIFQNQSNVLGYAVGHRIPASVPELKVKLENGDRILLATDGLFTSLSLAEIKRIITQKKPLNEIGRELKLKAAENQGKNPSQEGDNISLQIYEHSRRISTDELLKGMVTTPRASVPTSTPTSQLIAEAEAARNRQPATTDTSIQQLLADVQALTSDRKSAPTPPPPNATSGELLSATQLAEPLPVSNATERELEKIRMENERPSQQMSSQATAQVKTEKPEVAAELDVAQVEKMIDVLSSLANFMRQREYLASEIKDIQAQSMKAMGILENTLRQIEGLGVRLDSLKIITKK